MDKIKVLAAALACTFWSHDACADTFGTGSNAFEIEFVAIGNPGNEPDTTGNPNPVGSVGYAYRMGKFEVSEQMFEKANTLGNLNITKLTRGPNKPATRVDWLEAARFVNWLNTSTGGVPAYKFPNQPGESGYVGNELNLLWTSSDAGYNADNPYRNSRARYFLPSVHEWYKAAYYDPSSGVYYDFPTGSNAAPTPIASGAAAGTAVFNGQSGPADIALAGGLSPYGTVGQGGNILEWEETEFDLVNNFNESPRGLRGGYWDDLTSVALSSSNRGSGGPTLVGDFVGFRVASIPEPSTTCLAALGMLAISHCRRRNQLSVAGELCRRLKRRPPASSGPRGLSPWSA